MKLVPVSYEDAAPGAIGLVKASGGGKFGRAANWAIMFGTEAPCSHAVLKDCGNFILEAIPSRGVHLANVANYPRILWLEPEGTDECAKAWEAPEWIMQHAYSKEYNWPGIFAITWSQRRLPDLLKPNGWIAGAVSRDDKYFCSQLVDAAYAAVGVDLFPDRDSGMVSPGDLWRLAGSPDFKF